MINVPFGAKIEVPNGAYLCAESIEVNGELISIPQNLAFRQWENSKNLDGHLIE